MLDCSQALPKNYWNICVFNSEKNPSDVITLPTCNGNLTIPSLSFDLEDTNRIFTDQF